MGFHCNCYDVRLSVHPDGLLKTTTRGDWFHSAGWCPGGHTHTHRTPAAQTKATEKVRRSFLMTFNGAGNLYPFTPKKRHSLKETLFYFILYKGSKVNWWWSDGLKAFLFMPQLFLLVLHSEGCDEMRNRHSSTQSLLFFHEINNNPLYSFLKS